MIQNDAVGSGRAAHVGNGKFGMSSKGLRRLAYVLLVMLIIYVAFAGGR